MSVDQSSISNAQYYDNFVILMSVNGLK